MCMSLCLCGSFAKQKKQVVASAALQAWRDGARRGECRETGPAQQAQIWLRVCRACKLDIMHAICAMRPPSSTHSQGGRWKSGRREAEGPWTPGKASAYKNAAKKQQILPKDHEMILNDFPVIEGNTDVQ